MKGIRFLVNYMTSSSDPRPNISLAVFLDFGAEYAFLESLIEFLAFLVQKLGQNAANW